MNRESKTVKIITESTKTGEQIVFPLGRIKGTYPGPTLGIIAGIHGGEYCGMEAALRLYSMFEPSMLRGELRIVPVANIAGLMSRTMFVSPQDGKKLSSSFPGRVNGTYTEKLAAMIFREVIEPSDFVFEFRGGELVETMAHYISIQRTGNETYNKKARELAELFGAKNIILRISREAGIAESAFAAASFSGKVGLLAEAGGHGLRLEEDVNFIVSGVCNIASHLGMIDHQPSSPPNAYFYMDRFVDVTSPAEGIFDCIVRVDDLVESGQKLGTVRDFGGQVIAEITAPERGLILGIVTTAGVRKGITVIGIGAETDVM